MTATDELRRLLDERGVEWRGGLPTETMVDEPIDLLYVERPDGTLHVFVRSYLTPAQAVEATLGSDLKAENDKLREELAKWERLTAGINLPDYPVSQFVPKDLERENTKLRELVRDMWENGMCECDERGACSACEYHFPDIMRELGVEM